MDAEIYSTEYASERSGEIRKIEEEIRHRKKNTMLFQALPFHKRRRTASFDERRLPKDHRRNNRNKRRKRKQTVKEGAGFLKSHTWHAKRFKMCRSLGIPLPLCRTQKSDSFIRKSLGTRGILNDLSYMKVYVVAGLQACGECSTEKKSGAGSDKSASATAIDRAAGADRAGDGSPECAGCSTGCTIGCTTVEYTKRGDQVIAHRTSEREHLVIAENSECIEGLEKGAAEMRELRDVGVFQVFGAQSVFKEGDARGWEEALEGGGRKEEEARHVCIKVSEDKKLVLFHRSRTMEVMQRSIVKGIVPCSINELFRIGTELDKIVHPFDMPGTERGREMMERRRRAREEEEGRRQKGKRKEAIQPLFVRPFGRSEVAGAKGDGRDVEEAPNGERAFGEWMEVCTFVADKGSFSEGDPIVVAEKEDGFEMAGDEEVVGEVLRSSFSYRRGRTAGVALVKKTAGANGSANFFARQKHTKNLRRISLAVAGRDRVL